MKRRISKAEREARQRIGREHPFVACEECKDGWNETWLGVLRCRCWFAHQAKIDALVGARGGTRDAA